MSQESNPQGLPDSTALSSVLSTLLSKPELLEQIKSAVSASQTDPPPAPPTTDGAVPTSVSSSPVDGLSAVLANPTMMAMLPQLISSLAPMLAEGKKNTSADPKRSDEDCRNDLLCALKPFLSPERKHAVDVMLRISQLGNVIRRIK